MYVDEPDGFNRTALHWAAYQGDTFTVNALLKFGADVSKVDNTLFIPIHWAFMKGYKVVLKTLLKAGSDIHFKNDQGKDTFEIAKDMNCVSTWTKVLTECDRDPKNNWAPRKRFINPKVGKLITFFTPYVILPIVLNICSVSAGFGIPKLFLGFGIIAVAVFTLNKLVVPTYLIDDKAIQKSPIFAGIFSATAFWAVMVWTYAMLPITFLNHFFLNIFLGGCIGLFSWAFFKSMFINPGFVPTPADNSVILSQVRDLMAEGKFDTDHFCVNTFVRKPLRSKYSRHNNKLIARFDHYCPWVYNDIGVRNHKLFMTFVYALNLAIVFFTWLSIEYFDQLKDAYESDDEDSSIVCALVGDDLCYGYKNHHFHYNLIMWCWLQYIWIVFLCLVQTFQILKGVTTWEFSNLNNKIQSSRFNHSTVPRDFGIDTAPAVQQQPPNGRETGYNTCMQLLGIDQFVLTLKLSTTSFFAKSGSSTANETLRTVDIPTDYGFKQNWLDFWIIGEPNWRNVFYLPIKGENNLNGEVVDYYKLYEYPAKSATQVV
ncbi:uncharacterized protein SPAPADRAFT_153465 [Spathaspora passalidarum NRRL Y-27907]|uniref:Palmitoyltransferase n=1 Tax=Spathaspora passalidarum (strain NRRL Y-27907 / 11-Y1) TaxID=619300 RepID=G3AN95_SPAPN|nr:uncharacterized protein SPAPADRAFT_153465 [Spathaspora passalidarum NRRL Y-27907]EGW32478.1 hypothetical protein SPAPADRAFT_153465 [Spathaspora passalidarum NRRL Y-27907]